jgi:hypothetical protein
MSPVVGTIDWSPALDFNIGAAGIYTPVDIGFPGDGILANGELNKPQWVIAELDLDKIEHVRADGQVLNYQDWGKQAALATNVQVSYPISVAEPMAVLA